MLKYANYDIVFQEFPDEVTLAINLSLCPNRCPGCHSVALQGDIGQTLTLETLAQLVARYEEEITCVALMGGDNAPDEVLSVLEWVRSHYGERYKTGWYSGRTWTPPTPRLRAALSYLKLGPYVSAYGPLNKETTNQHFYRVTPEGMLEDITWRFWKNRHEAENL